jgi:alpha-1,6-mannosyltransferase
MPYDRTYRMPLRVDRMRRIVREEAPDVLQVSSPFVPAWVAATLKAKVSAYVYHADPIGCYVEPTASRLPGFLGERLLDAAWGYMRLVCHRFDVTVVASQWLGDALKQRGCQNSRVVPFGIQKGDLGPEKAVPARRAELLGPLADVAGSRLLLIAGRMAVDKRQALLVEAVRLVAARRPIGLVLLGDGPERHRLEALAASLPRVVSIPFTRDRAEYAELLASSDALVHGSLGETFGFVLAETLASGTPLVLPAAGGAQLFADPSCCEVYDAPGTSESVAAAIERLLERPPAELRASALEMARSVPSTDDHFAALIALYEELLLGARADKSARRH